MNTNNKVFGFTCPDSGIELESTTLEINSDSPAILVVSGFAILIILHKFLVMIILLINIHYKAIRK